MKKFSDFAKEPNVLSGDKLKIADVLNRLIVVKAYRILPSVINKGKDMLQIQFELDGEIRVVFTGSEVLTNQCKQYESNMPFETTIVKINKYLTFS